MYSQIAQVLKAAQSISIIAHTSPDADTLGSCFALSGALENMGKVVTVYTDCELPSYLSFLGENFTIYNAKDHQMPVDVCVCVDCGDLGRIGEREALLKLANKSINIDHHPTNTLYADINLVNPDAAATAEMIYYLIKELYVDINKCIAKNLYTAIVGDTGGFKYSNTTAKTHNIAAELLETGIEGWRICSHLFDSNPENAVRIKCQAIAELEILSDGLLGIALVTQDMLDKYTIAVDEVEGIVEMVRSIQGIEVAVLIKQGKDSLKVSMRSAEFVDVSLIAKEFGGGGHKRAAGFTISGDIYEIKKAIINTATSAIDKQVQRIKA